MRPQNEQHTGLRSFERTDSYAQQGWKSSDKGHRHRTNLREICPFRRILREPDKICEKSGSNNEFCESSMFCGYAFLVETLKLSAFFPEYPTKVSNAVNRKVETPSERLVPPRMAPKTTSVFDHVLFALKHEGVDLQILAEAVPFIDETEMQEQAEAHPSAVLIRKLGFLWEAFTGRNLGDIRASGNVVDLFDPDTYFTGPRRVSTKWRVNFNGIGDLSYCPTVRRTESLSEARLCSIFERSRKFLEGIPKTMVERAVEWAYLSETKSSFAIEKEAPSGDRAERMVALLKRLDKFGDLSEETLCDIQNQLISNPFDQAFSYRTEQNWLSNSGRGSVNGVTYVPPSPDILDDLMNGFLRTVSSAVGTVNPIVASAVASFGFVYLHPFMDGNGRISRCLVHKVFADAGVMPNGTILPVSAAMQDNEEAYLSALSKFSRPCRERWTVCYGDDFDFEFTGKSTIYRFWDATAQAEFMADMCETAIDVFLVQEVSWLREFDRIRKDVDKVFDVRDSIRSLLISVALENGRLSKNIRHKFADKVDPRIFDFIESLLPEDQP